MRIVSIAQPRSAGKRRLDDRASDWERIRSSWTFFPYDLIVSSGIRGPFHLYKHLGGFLYQNNVNVNLVWHSLFLGFLFLTFLAFWFLSFELTGDSLSSALVLPMIAVTHPLRGSLHAAAVPLAAFVTALAAMPFAFSKAVDQY